VHKASPVLSENQVACSQQHAATKNKYRVLINYRRIISSVTLGLSARPFPWWRMHPL